MQNGEFELARPELKEIKTRERASSEFLYFLAHLSHIAGSHITSFSVLSELIDRASSSVFSTEALKIIFPTPYWDTIQNQSKTLEIDPILIISLTKQESAFEPVIGSSVGAQGLMQIMPATAIETEPSLERSKLSEPETNIRVGSKYLKKMIQRFDGNIAFALAAYNAGPTAVDRWIKEKKADKGIFEFIEQIPYPETQNYVGSIIKNYYWYAKLLGAPALTDLSVFFKNTNSKEPSAR
jgi:soluble lytic murein transglycosylase